MDLITKKWNYSCVKSLWVAVNFQPARGMVRLSSKLTGITWYGSPICQADLGCYDSETQLYRLARLQVVGIFRFTIAPKLISFSLTFFNEEIASFPLNTPLSGLICMHQKKRVFDQRFTIFSSMYINMCTSWHIVSELGRPVNMFIIFSFFSLYYIFGLLTRRYRLCFRVRRVHFL